MPTNTCNSEIKECSNPVLDNAHLCEHCSAIEQDISEICSDFLVEVKEEKTFLFWQPKRDLQSKSLKSLDSKNPFTLDQLIENILNKYQNHLKIDQHYYIDCSENFLHTINYNLNRK
jgi:hypothetical protein